jgi:2-haloacid dehalogenase
LYDLLQREGERDLVPGHLLRARWEELQFRLLQGDYAPYREILARSLEEWMDERELRWNEREGEALVRAMESWQPFPDTVPALRRVKEAGVALAVISNTDRSIMQHTLRQLDGIEFDRVFVAEDCHAYKPSTEPFALALGQLGLPPEQILHVAFGFKYDIGPAQRLGMRTAWVNRKGEPRPGDEVPDHEWRDLWGLAELLG